MRYVPKVAAVGVIIVSLALPLAAFEREQIGVSGPSTGAAIQASPSAELTPTTGNELSAESTGTAINIPGLGTVGVIPKLDFGMELLYGAGPKPVEKLAPDNEADGLQIRGTIKHRF